MNLQETVSKILGKQVTVEQAKDFANDQFGVLCAYLKSQSNVVNLGVVKTQINGGTYRDFTM